MTEDLSPNLPEPIPSHRDYQEITVAHIEGIIQKNLSTTIQVHYNDGQAPDPVTFTFGPANGAVNTPPGSILTLGNSSCSFNGPHILDNIVISTFHPSNLGTFTATGSMNVGRGWSSVTNLPDGKILVAGGLQSGNAVSSAEIYDPSTGTFEQIGSMNAARFNHQATLLPNGKVLISGGSTAWGVVPSLASAELFDPETRLFTAISNMTSNRGGHCAILQNNGKVLITGGAITYYSVSTAELFDPATNTFTAISNLNTTRRDHTMTLLKSGEVLIAAGFSGGPTEMVEIYNPSTGEFTTVGSLSVKRYGHRSVLLPSGNVLIFGGYDGVSNIWSKVEMYNSTTRSCYDYGSLVVGRYEPTATLLPSGEILITGGDTTELAGTSSAELFDPSTQTSMAINSMLYPRAWHEAALLSNGTVLVVGGTHAWVGAENLSSAEIYTPSENDGAF